jgi:hypothetical protein
MGSVVRAVDSTRIIHLVIQQDSFSYSFSEWDSS